MLYPYSRAAPARPTCRLDGWRADGFRLLEADALEVAAPPERALEALLAVRIREMPVVRALFGLRGLGVPPDATLRACFSTRPFAVVEEEPGREVVFGVLVPGAGTTVAAACASPAAFREALGVAPLGVVANFRAEARGGGSLLWTETWVRTRGWKVSAGFGAYWMAIGPFSAWTRRIFLRAARRRAEPESGRPLTLDPSPPRARGRGEE